MGKILFIFTLLLMFLAASFAYSGGQQQEDEGGVIQYWTSQSEPNIKATFERLFDEFETQSGYEVVQTYVPNDQVALKWAAAAGSGKLPDVFNTTPHSLVTYGVTGQLEHLDDIVNDFEGWYPAMIRDVEYDGHYYAIPWHASVVFLYYRTDMLGDKGLSAPEDWSQLESAASKLTGDGAYGLPVPVSSDLVTSYIGYAYMRSTDGSVYDDDGNIGFDQSNNVEAFKFIRRLYNNVSPPAASGYGFGDYKNTYWSGSAPLIIYYGSLYPDMHKYAPDLEDKTGYTRMPINDKLGYKPDLYTNHQSYAFSVPTGARKKEGAKKLIRFLLQPENNIDLINSDPADCLPQREPLLDNQRFWKHETVSKFKDAVEFQLGEIPHSSELLLAKGKHPYGTAIFHSLALSAAINKVALTDEPIEAIVKDLHEKYKEIADE